MPESIDPFGPPRIMMVDDEMANLHIVKIMLTREDFPHELIIFQDGEKALAYLTEKPVDLILLDLAMPGLDGFEVMQRIKGNSVTRHIPVIFLTAYQDAQYILKGFEMGATDFLSKPIMSPVLTARIMQVIETQTLEKRLRHSNTVLQATNQIKDELLSICSHDLKAPLATIDLLCNLLEDSTKGLSRRQPEELIHRIMGQTNMARRLVENLLNLNRIEEGQLIPAPAFFSIAEELRACAESEVPALTAREIGFTQDLPEGAWLCYGDREMLSQVVYNLLNNAIKHTNSSIHLSARVLPSDTTGEGVLELVVRDDGPGIPKDLQGNIFEKFHKLDAQGGGSGLGLYISRQMMRLHHGEISVESTPGQGCAFKVLLPNLFLPEILPDLSDLHDTRVWAVSTSRRMGQDISALLEEAGLVNVQVIEKTEDINRAIMHGAPSIAVIDIHTAMLGHQVVQALDGGEFPPAIALYGTPEAAEAFGHLISRPYQYLAAPLNPGRLLSMIKDKLS